MKRFVFAIVLISILLTLTINAAATNIGDTEDLDWMGPLLDYGEQLEEENSSNSLFDNIFDGFISKLMRSMYTRLIEVLMLGMNSVMSLAGNFLRLDIIHEALNFTTALAISLLIPKVLFEIINTYFLFRAGDPDADIKNLIIRIMFACFVVATSATIYQILFDFGVDLGNDVAVLVSVGRTTAGDLHVSPGGTSLLLIIYMFILMMVYFQMLVRGAEMAVYKVLMPLFSLNLTSVNQGYFGAFMRQSLVVCLSQVLQILLFKITLSVLVVDSAGSLLPGIAFAWITFRSPKLLKEITYSSGLGSSVGAAARTITSYVIRRI